MGGTSPVIAGGLLYVYDWDGGELNVYAPTSGKRVAAFPVGRGHWNTPDRHGRAHRTRTRGR